MDFKPLVSTPQTKRKSYYPVGEPISALKISKLPKNNAVLICELMKLKDEKDIKSVCYDVANEVCDVWKHHFGLRLVCGKEHETQKCCDRNVKFIVEIVHISGKIQRLYHEWKDLEKTS